MISFLETPQPRTPDDSAAGLRTHVLRVVNSNQILYSVATSKRTEIQLVKINSCRYNSNCDAYVNSKDSSNEKKRLTNNIIYENNNENNNNPNCSNKNNSNNYDLTNDNLPNNNNTGYSTTVIAFNRYMDIIDADLSSDLEMLVYTERMIIGNSFKYESVLCHIHSFSKLKVFKNADPIASYFIPENANYMTTQKTNTYQIMHIIGDKVLHFRVSFRNQKVDVRILRDGINLSGCKKWFFSQKEMIFYAMQNTDMSVYSISEEKGLKKEKFSYFNDEKSFLPRELALIPSTLVNLPYYRFSSGISFCMKTPNDDYGVIEQLYRDDDSSLAFTVATLRGKFHKLVAVPGTQPDLPISFISHQKVVFVFVPNCFITMIDFNTETPHITMMPKSFCLSGSSRLTVSVNSSNFLTDLESGKLYRCRFSLMNFPSNLHYTNRAVLSMFAKLATTLPKHISIPGTIAKLPADISCIQYFFKGLFSYANQVTSGNVNLSNFYRRKSEVNNNYNYNLAVYNKNNNKNNIGNSTNSSSNMMLSDDSEEERSTISAAVFSKFKRSKSSKSNRRKSDQGEIEKEVRERKVDFVAKVKDSIAVWEKEKGPSGAQQLAIEVAAVFEAKAAKMPALPVNTEIMNERTTRICPETIRALLVKNGVIEKAPKNEEEKDEIMFWKSRLNLVGRSSCSNSSCSSSTNSSCGSGSGSNSGSGIGSGYGSAMGTKVAFLGGVKWRRFGESTDHYIKNRSSTENQLQNKTCLKCG